MTHDHDEAFTLADRVAVMRAGRIVQAGPPARGVAVTRPTRTPPGSSAAALFLPATVRDGVATCELGVGRRCRGRRTAQVALGLRPTALRPADSGVTGEVVQRVHRRDHVRLRVRLEDGRQVVDAVAGVLDAGRAGRPLALDQDGVALVSRPG